MKEIKRDNALINYEIHGSGEVTLLFVHGSNIDQTYWKEQAAFFSGGHRVVTIDLPGHGKSGQERSVWSLEGFALDVIEVIKELELNRVILIGHSMGCDVGLMAAGKAPELIMGFIGIDNCKNAGVEMSPEFQEQSKALIESLKADFANTNEQFVRKVLITPQTPEAIATRVIDDYRRANEPR